MDLGIQGRWALVCGASKGLGLGCAQALAEAGVNIVLNARNPEALASAAGAIRAATGVQVIEAAADVTTETGRSLVLAAHPVIDILVTNAGGPPAGDFRRFDRDDWIRALDANMLTPIELIRSTIDTMVERGWGRIVNITSSSVKSPIPALGLSNGARSGLTGFVAGLARQVARQGVTINNLLPGAFDTDRLRSNIELAARQNNTSVEAARAQRIASIPAGRLGQADEFGKLCAFVCSNHASYLTGQNLLLDGGTFPGTF
jgi:3-oxoacyl-[acyl-carrier protein] reductase